MTKTEKLKLAYNDMKAGKIIRFKSAKDCRCWITHSNNPNCKRKFIFWRCYGQSANRMGLSNLRWIAKVIAECPSYDYDIVQTLYLDY